MKERFRAPASGFRGEHIRGIAFQIGRFAQVGQTLGFLS